MYYKKTHIHILLCLRIRLVQARQNHRATVNAVMSLGVPQYAGNFLTSRRTVSFSRTCQAAVCSAPGSCATEHDIRVQQQQAFKTVTILHCALLRRQTRRLTSHTRLSSSKATPVSLNFVPTKPNLNLSRTSAPPDGYNE